MSVFWWSGLLSLVWRGLLLIEGFEVFKFCITFSLASRMTRKSTSLCYSNNQKSGISQVSQVKPSLYLSK